MDDASASASLTAMHVADEVRLTQVRVVQVVHKKRRLAFLTVEDAETGQRGYLLTGDPAYLGPYAAALSRMTGTMMKTPSRP